MPSQLRRTSEGYGAMELFWSLRHLPTTTFGLGWLVKLPCS